MQAVPFVQCAALRSWLSPQVPQHGYAHGAPTYPFESQHCAPPHRLLTRVWVHSRHSLQRVHPRATGSLRDKRDRMLPASAFPDCSAAASASAPAFLWRCDRGSVSRGATLTPVRARALCEVPVLCGDGAGPWDLDGACATAKLHSAANQNRATDPPSALAPAVQTALAHGLGCAALYSAFSGEYEAALSAHTPLARELTRLVAAYARNLPSLYWLVDVALCCAVLCCAAAVSSLPFPCCCFVWFFSVFRHD